MKFKFIKKIATVVSVGVLAFTGYNALVNSNDGTESSSSKLGKVTDLSYDNSSFTLDWKDVKNADYYTVNIDGAEYKAEESEFSHIINKDVTNFKVKACSNDIVNVFSGDWSDTYTYTMEKEQSTIVNDLLAVLDRKNSYGANPQVLTWEIHNTTFHVVALFNVGDRRTIQSVTFCEDEIRKDSTLEEILEIINNSTEGARIDDDFTLTESNFIYDLIQKRMCLGKLKELQDKGYKISVVTAAADEIGERLSGFNVYGLFKAEKSGDVVYVSQSFGHIVKEETGFTNQNYSDIFDQSKIITLLTNESVLTGDFEEFAKLYETALSAQNSKDMEK